MLDRHIVPLIKPALRELAVVLDGKGVNADALTLGGFLVGVGCIPAVAFGLTELALLLLLINRLADGLDGELARLKQPTDAGGYLDITLDFIFYAMFPLGFAFADPSQNAIAAAVLITSFVGTGSSFLAFATQAEKRNIVSPDFGYKGLYYLNGLAEGTETIICFMLMCLFPQHFATLAWIFASVCAMTAVNRVYCGYRTLASAADLT